MEQRRLGRSGMSVPPIIFGGNVFGWTADEATSHRILDAFVDAGFSFVDTADVYSRWKPGNKGGESETVIGSWLKKNPASRQKRWRLKQSVSRSAARPGVNGARIPSSAV